MHAEWTLASIEIEEIVEGDLWQRVEQKRFGQHRM